MWYGGTIKETESSHLSMVYPQHRFYSWIILKIKHNKQRHAVPVHVNGIEVLITWL